VVEHSIGNGEVDSSILSGSTSFFATERALFPAEVGVSAFPARSPGSHFGNFSRNEQ
jgi:hypothetical protein